MHVASETLAAADQAVALCTCAAAVDEATSCCTVGAISCKEELGPNPISERSGCWTHIHLINDIRLEEMGD